MKSIKDLNPVVVRIVSLAVGATLSIGVLAFSLLAITAAINNDFQNAAIFLLLTFVVLGTIRLVGFIRNRTKINFIRFAVLFILNIALGITVIFAKDNDYLFILTAGLYCISIVISRVFRIIQDHSVRSIVLNGIVIVFFLLLSVGLLMTIEDLTEDLVASVITLECTIMALSAVIEVVAESFTHLKFKVLFKIIFRTFALEVLFGLLVLMVSFSLILMRVEPNITNFPDALWYCFAVVTTIGFGDFSAVTLTGRILTVILGIYGIVVVAIITSIVVNFYNETAGKNDIKELKDIKEEEKKDKK